MTATKAAFNNVQKKGNKYFKSPQASSAINTAINAICAYIEDYGM
jgi:hypothetical protein